MSDVHTLDEHLVQHLPLPLAQLCRRGHNAKSPLERHQAAFYLWEAALKLLASVAVVEYAEIGKPDADLAERLKNLARPSLGHWWEFIRLLVPPLAEAGDAGFVAVRDSVLQKRARDDLPRAAGLDAALRETFEGRSGARSTVCLRDLFDRLVQYRNREIGHGAAGQRAAEYYERMARLLLAAALEVLGRVDVLAGRQLRHVGEVRRHPSGSWLVERYTLIGETAKRCESLEFAEAEASRLPRPERVYVEATAGGPDAAPVLRALYPLVHYEAACGHLYYLNARRGQRSIEYLSYGSGDILRRDDLGNDRCALLARVLGQPVPAEAAEAWAAQSCAEDPLPKDVADEPVGRTIGEFELLGRLGQGGMGVVYRARQPSLGRQVALKCLLRAGDTKAEARFSREIRALGRVEHPNVVKVFTSGTEGDQWFYTMELIEGAELSRVCAQLAGSSATDIDEVKWRGAVTTACEQARSQETALATGPAPLARPAAVAAVPAAGPVAGRGHVTQVVAMVRQVADAVHALHEAGVVHRDIKPGNIMLTTDGAHPVLMDLGLAQLADETEGRVTRTRQFVGTLRYASPEQVLSAGRVDRRTDVYSLGATLWELLTLRPLFGAGDETTTPELMLKIQTTDPERPRKYNQHVPRDLEAIVMKCLEKDLTRRYATAADLAADLGRFLNGEPVSAQPPSFSYLAGKFARRYRAPLAVAAGVLALLAVGTVFAFVSINDKRHDAINAKNEAIKAKDDLEAFTKVLGEKYYAVNIAYAERELGQNLDVALAGKKLEDCQPRLRGWEWDYLMRLRDGARPPLIGHEGGLWMAVFSPDGKHIATASMDGTAKIWDAATSRELFTVKHWQVSWLPRVPVMCVAFSPDGRQGASGSLEIDVSRALRGDRDPRKMHGEVKIWDAATGKVTLTVNKIQMGLVDALAFSPDGSKIASSSISEDSSFVVWNAKTGQDVRVVRGHTSHVHRIRFSPDGSRLISGSTDGTIKIWDAASLHEIHPIPDAHPAPVYGLAFAPPDGAHFVSAGVDGTVRIWETATGTRVRTLRGHTGAALGVAYSPDGKHIASSGYDKAVRLWDAASGEEKITLRGHTELIPSVAFSPDGLQILSASFDKTARIWDASPPNLPDEPGMFTLVGDKDRVEAHTDRVNAVAFSPDGRLLASASWDKTVRLWDAQTGHWVRTLEGHEGPVFGVAFSPDSTRIASASWDRTVKIWDVASGITLRTTPKLATPVQGLAFSPDGKSVVSSSFEGLVRISDVETGAEIRSFPGHVFPTVAVAYSPDGKLVVSGSGDQTAKVWNVASGAEVRTFGGWGAKDGHTGMVAGVAFSPDGERIATASWDSKAKIWNAKSGKVLHTLIGHTDRVNGVAFSPPDGKRIATASEDKTVRIWDAATGKEIGAPRVHRGIVWSVAFSPDGKRVAAGCWSPDSYVKTWPAE